LTSHRVFDSFLRPYQLQALEISKRKFEAGVTRQLISLPTGTGKTVVFSNLLRHHEIDKRMLVLVHRQELAEQAFAKLRKYNPGLKIGIEMGKNESWSSERIVIAGVNTIGTATSGRIKQFRASDFGAIVCDEAHHAIADSYMRVFHHFGLFEPDNKTLLLGVTAIACFDLELRRLLRCASGPDRHHATGRQPL
jgi:ATP-dependent helicase IRC3